MYDHFITLDKLIIKGTLRYMFKTNGMYITFYYVTMNMLIPLPTNTRMKVLLLLRRELSGTFYETRNDNYVTTWTRIIISFVKGSFHSQDHFICKQQLIRNVA